MICRTSRDLPASLRGYGIWLHVFCGGEWVVFCQLTATQARQVLRMADRQFTRPPVRIFTEKV